MINQIIIPTGYMGSGSSAVTDVISEIEGYSNLNKEFEFVFLHCPDGVFDLEDKLLIGNNSIRSDEALHAFRKQMSFLYEESSLWVTGYKRRISPEFMNWIDDFIDSLIDTKTKESYWYYQQIPDNDKMKIQNSIKVIAKKMIGKKLSKVVPKRYEEMWIAYPDSKQFYTEAQKLIEKVINALCDSSNLIVDQLLLPHNLFRMSNYFDDRFKVFVVERDPRDVFILNKYYWMPQKCPVPYPLDVEEFCKVYKKMRDSEKSVENSQIMRLHFEDLVYRYDDILKEILEVLKIPENKHINKGERFDPNRSINNTQLFLDDKYALERNIIERELEEFIYHFPYELKLRNGDVF